MVAASCHASDNDNVMACLMEQLSKNSPAMTSTCSEVLMQIHYFLAREIIIDTHLYQACYNDAIKVCNGAPNWKQTKDNPKNLLVFPCLVRNLYNDEDDFENQKTEDKEELNEYKLSDACVSEVERTLRQRAMSVNLHPDIEEDCRDFLHTKCLSHVEPGEELGCLQVILNKIVSQVGWETSINHPINDNPVSRIPTKKLHRLFVLECCLPLK